MVMADPKDDNEEKRLNWLSILWDVGKTLGFAGLLIGLGGLITYAIMGKDGVKENFGVQGMYAVNAITGIFSDTPIYSGKEISDYIRDNLTAEQAGSLFSQALATTDFKMGDETLKVMAATENRETLMGLLNEAEFDFADPSGFSSETISKLINAAITKENDSFAKALLKAAAKDIKSAKVAGEAGIWQNIKDFVTGQRSDAILAEDTLGLILKNYPAEGADLFAAMTDNEAIAKIITADEFKTGLKTITERMSEEDLSKLSLALRNYLQTSDAEALADTLSNWEFKGQFKDEQEAALQMLADGIRFATSEQAQAFLETNRDQLNTLANTLGEARMRGIGFAMVNAFAEGQISIDALLKNEQFLSALQDPEAQTALFNFIKNIDLSSLSTTQQMQATALKLWLIAPSSEQSKTHFDIISSTANDPDLLVEIANAALSLLDPNTDRNTIAISARAGEYLNRLNFNYDEFAAILAPHYAAAHNAEVRNNSNLVTLNNIAAGLNLFGAKKIEDNLSANNVLTDWQNKLPSLLGVVNGQEAAIYGNGESAIIDNILDEHIIQPSVTRYERATATAR